MKLNIRNTIYLTICLTIIAFLSFILYTNCSSNTQFTISFMQKVYTLSFVLYTILISIISGILGYFICCIAKSKSEQLCNAYQKKHENIKLEKDTDTAKIATLEAKIKTLEVALAKALGK